MKLPDPTGADEELTALVWKDNHIDYSFGAWTYDGEMKDDRPEGQGILVGDRYHGERRYEGTFKNGQYVDPKTFQGEIRLHAISGHQHWSISGFGSYEVTKTTSDTITIYSYDKTYQLKHGETLYLRNSIEGHEWSDGCVYDSDEYSLELKWIE